MNEWHDIEAQWELAHEVLSMCLASMDPALIIKEAELRHAKGKAEHEEDGTVWTDWTGEDFADNIKEELIDAMIYTAKAITWHAKNDGDKNE